MSRGCIAPVQVDVGVSSGLLPEPVHTRSHVARVERQNVHARIAPVQAQSATTGVAPVQAQSAVSGVAPVQARFAASGVAPVQAQFAVSGVAPVQARFAVSGVAPVQAQSAVPSVAPVHGPRGTLELQREAKMLQGGRGETGNRRSLPSGALQKKRAHHWALFFCTPSKAEDAMKT